MLRHAWLRQLSWLAYPLKLNAFLPLMTPIMFAGAGGTAFDSKAGDFINENI